MNLSLSVPLDSPFPQHSLYNIISPSFSDRRKDGGEERGVERGRKVIIHGE